MFAKTLLPSSSSKNKKLPVVIGTITIIVILLTSLIFWLTKLRERRIIVSQASQNSSLQQDSQPTRVEKQLVEGFPDFTPYPNASIEYSTVKQAEQDFSYEGVWKTSENIDLVVTWYKENLVSNGWVIEIAPDVPGTFEQFFVARKGNMKLYLTIEASESGEETEIVADIISQSVR